MTVKSGFPLTIFALALTLTLSNLFCLWFGLSPLYALGITATAAALIYLFRSPLHLLFALLIVRMSLDFFGETTSLKLTQDVSVTLSQLIGVGVALLGLVLFSTNREARQSLRFSLPLLLVMVWGVFTLLFSLAPGTTGRELLRVFDIATLAALAYSSVRTLRDYGQLVGSILISSIVPVTMGILQFVRGIGFQDEAVDIPRIYGTFSHPNVFSLYLFTLLAVITIATLIYRRSFLPMTSALLLGALVASTLVLTYTRVAWITFFLFLLIIAVLRFRLLLIPLIVAPTLLYFIFLPFQERVDSMFHASPGSSVAWRQSLWSATIHKTIDDGRSALGFGMGTFYTVSGQLYDPSIGQNEAHNDFVKFFVEGGAIGLIIYLLYLAAISLPLFRRTFFTSSKLSSDDSASPSGSAIFLILLALAVSLAFASLSDNIFKNTPVQWIFWVLLAASYKVFSGKKKTA